MIEGHDYTIVSNGPGGRARMYALLALITAFLTPLAQHWSLIAIRRYWGDDWNIAETALFFGGFTALLLFGILINVFDIYLWRTRLGGLMFQLTAMPVPPNLAGEYRGTIELFAGSDPTASVRTNYVLRIAQTWEQISCSLQSEGQGGPGGMVRVYSDMANIRVGMMSDVTTLRFVYTFEENLPRREGVGTTARQSSGASTLEFRRQGEAWVASGHFFDDIGRSGQLRLSQMIPGALTAAHAVPGTPGPQAPPAAAATDRTT
jgi:hypothetical protein